MERLLQFLELRPDLLVDELLRRTSHYGVPPLPRVAVRIDSAAPQQRNEESLRPRIRKRELEFEQLAGAGLIQSLLDTTGSLLRRGSLSV